jgi:hypothetical protein
MNKYIKFLLQPPVTKEFKHKLKHNFHTLTPGEMVIYFLFIRPFWKKEERFFFEGSLALLGQMYTAERKALYETILKEKPRQCYEIGTYTGGGSTFFLASAFAKIGSGSLVTMENNDHYYQKGKKYYAEKLPNLNKHIDFIFGDKSSSFNSSIPADGKVDCVFFDGAEEAQQTLDQYNYFKPFLKKGSIIMFHDWNTDKSRLVKPVILNDSNWAKEAELTPPNSIGFAIFKHL